MPVRCLSFVEYGETGWGWHLEKVRNPTWDDVLISVDRLDKFRYPWVWLFIGENEEDATLDCLTIMGGEGIYWVEDPKRGRRPFLPPRRGKTVVENFDVVNQAGGIGRATTMELRGIVAARQLELRFVSKSRYAPMVSGVEVFRQERLEK